MTDLMILLRQPISRGHILEVAHNHIGNHPERFPELFRLISHPEKIISWRAAWACEKLCETSPEWFMEKRKELTTLSLSTPYDGTRRLLLSMLCLLPVEEPISVELLNSCLDRIFDPRHPIAVQAFSIRLAYKLCLTQPELLSELKLCLESEDMEYHPAGIRSTVKNVLKQMRKNNANPKKK